MRLLQGINSKVHQYPAHTATTTWVGVKGAQKNNPGWLTWHSDPGFEQVHAVVLKMLPGSALGSAETH